MMERKVAFIENGKGTLCMYCTIHTEYICTYNTWLKEREFEQIQFDLEPLISAIHLHALTE